MEGFSNKAGYHVVKQIIDAIINNREFLSEIDGAIGDGDHGINMAKGFHMASDALDPETATISSGFQEISKTLMNKIGGSMGPLYGSLFRGFFIISRDCETIDGEVVKAMLIKAADNIASISQAQLNDKTLVDVLYPARDAYALAWDQSHDLHLALVAMNKAADEDWKQLKRWLLNLEELVVWVRDQLVTKMLELLPATLFLRLWLRE